MEEEYARKNMFIEAQKVKDKIDRRELEIE